MTADYLLVPHPWRRQLAVVRLILGLCCVAAYARYPALAHPLVLILFCLYSAAATAVLSSTRLAYATYAGLALGVDAFFFLLCAANPAVTLVWLTFGYYVYLLLLAALLFDWSKVLWVTLGVMAFAGLVQPPQLAPSWPVVLMTGVLALILALQKRSFHERLSAAFRRTLLARSEAEVARVAERQRIAADFHDGPLQSFISFQMRLEILRKVLAKDPGAARDELLQLQELCKGQVTELRTFVRSMRPGELDAASLSTSLRQIVNAFRNDTGVLVTIQANGFQSPSDPDDATEVLQIVREALYNIHKHSRASRAAIQVANIDNRLEVTIEDDGGGFPFSGTFSLDELDQLRLGPVSIKRRVRGLDGELILESRPGRGATLRVRIPL